MSFERIARRTNLFSPAVTSMNIARSEIFIEKIIRGTGMEDNGEVKKFYEEQCDESRRELVAPLEFIRTKSIVSRYLTENEMNVADIAGGVGVYSFWLAGLGHRPHLLDLARNHIESAKKRSDKTGVRLASYTCADARRLPYEDGSMDMALLMGALYHLRKRGERLKCLYEAGRVLKRNGALLCTVQSKFAPMIGIYKWRHIDGKNMALIDETLKSGNYDNPP